MTTLSIPAERRVIAELTDGNRDRLSGIGLMCAALVCLSCLDCSSKWLGYQHIPLIEILFARYFVALLLTTLLFNPVRMPRAWHTPKLWLQTLRALALLGSTICTFMAFRTMPLADIMAINFALPLVIVLLAGPILGEHIGAKQWLAILIGFGGILVVTRPGVGSFDPAVIWCFGTVACNVFYQIATRKLSGVTSAASMLLISTAMATALIAPFVPSVWITPHSTFEWGILLIPGTFGAMGHYLLVRAYAFAPAPVIAPFSYTQIVWSSLLGFLVFGDMPGIYTIAGAGIVISSGLYLIYLETKSQRRRPEALAVPAE